MKEVFIIGGPNGAGKSTFVEYYLPKYIKVTNFINADHIAKGLAPLNHNSQSIRAGKLMLQLIDEHIEKNVSFGFETTLAGQKWIELIRKLKVNGYKISIFFLDIDTTDLAINRVEKRVELGGHDIPELTIRRRFTRARFNFWNKYRQLSDEWYLFNNSEFNNPQIIVFKENNTEEIVNEMYFKFFLNSLKGEL